MLFPEGTWNLSPNELIYDIQLGTVDMAIETGAAIIPISVEIYDEKKKFVINFGSVMEINGDQDVTRDFMIQKTTQLRDTMATLKYEIWEQEGVFRREDITSDYWCKFVIKRCAEWWGYDFKEQIINCYIPKEKSEYWDLMRDLRNMRVSEENMFLFMKKDAFYERNLRNEKQFRS